MDTSGRCRSSSLSSFSGQRVEGTAGLEDNPSKRKESEAAMEISAISRHGFDDLVLALVAKACALDGYISQTANTKKEIKDAGSDVMRMFLKLQRLNRDRVKASGTCQKLDIGTQTLRNMETREAQMDPIGEDQKPTVQRSTRTS
nr:unnamed protein product [Callosobruchus analis]